MVAWSTVAPMSAARWQHAAAASGSCVYAIGGQATAGGSPVATVEKYDPATNTWATVAPLNTARLQLAAATDDSGYIYAIGGKDTGGNPVATVERYDPATNTWTTVASMPVAGFLVSAATIQGNIYVIGSGPDAYTTYKYNTVSNTWTTVAPTLHGRRSGCLAASGGFLYAMSGNDDANHYSAAVDKYNPATNTWATVATPPSTCGQQAAVDADGYVYNFDATVQRYSPATNTWATVESPPASLTGFATTTDSSSRLYVIGGEASSGGPRATVYQGNVNVAPNAATPVAPVGNPAINRGLPQRFSWTFSDPNTGDSQSKADIQYRLVGAPSWTQVTEPTGNHYHDFAANVFASGNYEWQVRTYDAGGLVGPWSASALFTTITNLYYYDGATWRPGAKWVRRSGAWVSATEKVLP